MTDTTRLLMESRRRPHQTLKDKRAPPRSTTTTPNPDQILMTPSSSPSSSSVKLVLAYVIFGALHELAHLLTAAWLGVLQQPSGESRNILVEVFSSPNTLLRTLLGRQFLLESATGTAIHEDDSAIFWIRHAGWIASLIIALIVSYTNYCNHSTENRGLSTWSSSYMLLAAWITLAEAVSTDLLGLPVFSSISMHKYDDMQASATVFFCGNFGIIVLHQAWLHEQTKGSNGNKSKVPACLDVLERMVQVTMMRGAQSGGVVTFRKDNDKVSGIRSRVVNRKRTDLSQLIRSSVQRDMFSSLSWLPFKTPKIPVPTFFAGHTRFATSSKATLDGTHPQQWTSAEWKRVCDFEAAAAAADGPVCYNEKLVENYITHNGDFDFYTMKNGQTYDLEFMQQWLVRVTGVPRLPAVVDSCAVAGMVDVLRTQGCFGLSARYALAMEMISSSSSPSLVSLWSSPSTVWPSCNELDRIGTVFEEVLHEMLKGASFESVCNNDNARRSFGSRVASKLESASNKKLLEYLDGFVAVNDEEDGGSNSLLSFCVSTINAFFDNDLFWTTKTFMKYAKGSFGLCVTSSLDAERQIAMAARGQTMSIAFYPIEGLICYGSEQAAVKAGLNTDFPGSSDGLGRSQRDVDNDVLRLDLDDLGGEIVVVDWGVELKSDVVSRPNRDLVQHELMNGAINIIMHQESCTTTRDPQIYHRMTRLTRNKLVKPLRPDANDPILSDIQDIPRICQDIQDDWHSDRASTSLNRLTAYNLSRSLRARLEAHVAGTVDTRAVDILLTGCEVSLWLAEQFASDLQKAFPKLNIVALSSNKLLGLYGQEIPVPSIGFPYSPRRNNLDDAIVIIVSHSGGTFAPLSCSNLLQSKTKNLFVVTSEWDTQVGKQLRAMDAMDDETGDSIFRSRVFSTEVGIRPAEPCSISVAATHQLLTNLFEYICVVILSDERFRETSAAVITEQDLRILERANQDSIEALTEIVGTNKYGVQVENDKIVERQLRQAGDVWAEHVLECAKAYIMSFVYIFATVTSGFPLFYAIAFGAGLDPSSEWAYVVRLFDSMLYFWLPQVNIFMLRLWQGRNLRHRMVGRCVAIADIPWVSQAAEAFLSKIFAVSYSIAGLNVLSGNPADHFVHRHTHKVVRGTLMVCGRPDGRLSALATAEASACLSVNQASSIQSLGGTCESLTIGHNPFKLPLSKQGIFLKRKRPMFLCERMLVENDASVEQAADINGSDDVLQSAARPKASFLSRLLTPLGLRSVDELELSLSFHHDSSVRPRSRKKRSAPALIGAYMNIEEQSNKVSSASMPTLGADCADTSFSVDNAVESAIKEKQWSDNTHKVFQSIATSGDGFITKEEFLKGVHLLKPGTSPEQARAMFGQVDADRSGRIDYHEFLMLLRKEDLQSTLTIPASNRNVRGDIQIEASREKYFGEILRKLNAGKSQNQVDFTLARSQHFSQELYETRVASLQRFVSMTVMFHQMGRRVSTFFSTISFGFWGYRMDRTHSIMRIATTASPVSGAEVRQQMRQLQLLHKVNHSVNAISIAYLKYKKAKDTQRLKSRDD